MPFIPDYYTRTPFELQWVHFIRATYCETKHHTFVFILYSNSFWTAMGSFHMSNILWDKAPYLCVHIILELLLNCNGFISYEQHIVRQSTIPLCSYNTRTPFELQWVHFIWATYCETKHHTFVFILYSNSFWTAMGSFHMSNILWDKAPYLCVHIILELLLNCNGFISYEQHIVRQSTIPLCSFYTRTPFELQWVHFIWATYCETKHHTFVFILYSNSFWTAMGSFHMSNILWDKAPYLCVFIYEILICPWLMKYSLFIGYFSFLSFQTRRNAHETPRTRFVRASVC